MWYLSRPTPEHIRAVCEAQRPLPFTYSGVGATRSDSAPAGYVHDRHRRQLGTGERAFAAARDAIRAWKMFPSPLATIEPVGIPIAEGEVAIVVAHILGVWTLHATRIVYVIDEPRRFGFAYGTLPGHATRGEERFLVEWLPDDAVWYDLQAFSRQRSWLTRLALPITRRLQLRFARMSQAAMAAAVRAAG